jgi:transcription initiation factor TFIIB
MMLRELNIKIIPINPIDYTARFASSLKLSPKVQTKSVKLAEQLKKKGMTSGLSPVSVAASTLYIAGLMLKEKRTQREVAEVSGITETTLRNRCKDIIRELKLKAKVR